MNELYSLKWKNHQVNLVDVFEELWEKEAFIDVTLSCPGGRNFPAHRMVLSACSPYFHSLFLDPALRVSQQPVVFLRDVKGDELEALLRFMYRGHIDVMHEDLGPLLQLAHVLQIKGLATVTNEDRTRTMVHGDGATCEKRPCPDDGMWAARVKKRKSDSPVSSTSRVDDSHESGGESQGQGGRKPSNSPHPVMPDGENQCDRDVQSTSVTNGDENNKGAAEDGSATNSGSASGANSTPTANNHETEESAEDSMEFDYGDHPPEASRWLKTEVADIDDEEDDLDDDIEDVDDDVPSGDEGNALDGVDLKPRADLASDVGENPGDVMMPLLVRPDLIGNCVRQLFCMRGAGGEPGPLGLLPPSLGATPQSSLPSSASTIAAIPVGADGQSIQCSLCLKVIQRVSFARHKRMHKMAEGSIASVHECDVCNRKFYRKDNYVKHLDSSAHFKALRQKRSLMELTQQQQLHQQLCAGLPVFPRSSPSPPAFATPYQPPSLGVVKPGSDDGRAESADDADEDTKGNRSAPASP